MSQSSLDRVTVLGAGVLGAQIAFHCAFRGKQVVQYDLHADALKRARAAHTHFEGVYRKRFGLDDAALSALKGRLRYTTDLADAAGEADLVIESVPEVPAIKTQVYQQLAPLLPAHTLVATNSSTLLPRDFADATGRPERYCSLHFANLLWSLNLVEIMGHPTVASDTLLRATQFAIEIGMVPIPVGKEQNGYVLNTWLVSLMTSTLGLVVDGVCTPEDVDRTFLIANRPARVGPFGMADLVGMRTIYNILRHWGEERDDDAMRRGAEYVRENYLDKGYLGTSTGRGFYRYPNPAYAAPGFLDVPDLSEAAAIARRSELG